MAKVIKNLESLAQACVEARRQFEREEVRYLEFLATVENDHENIWKPACGTFLRFVEEYVGKPRPARYAEFTTSVSAMGIEYVRTNGIDAATVAIRIESPDKRAEFASATRDWAQMHDGVHPSKETARELRQKIDPQPSVPRSTGQVRELEELRAQCDKLKRENHQLARELDKLRTENTKLLQRIAKGNGSKRQVHPSAE
jgi:hypothetical protein